jgi:hypothetical protein
MILITDNEGRAEAVFKDPVAAAEYAESNECFATSYQDGEGPLTLGEPVFWECRAAFDGQIETVRTTQYKFGSASAPCRDGTVFAGRVVEQDMGCIVAWGASEAEAVSRAKDQLHEGRKRAARDSAWKAAIDAGRKAESDAGRDVQWDPYGLWIDRIPGLREKAVALSDEAYNSIT